MCGPASLGMRALNWNGMCADCCNAMQQKAKNTFNERNPFLESLLSRDGLRKSSGKGVSIDDDDETRTLRSHRIRWERNAEDERFPVAVGIARVENLYQHR